MVSAAGSAEVLMAPLSSEARGVSQGDVLVADTTVVLESSEVRVSQPTEMLLLQVDKLPGDAPSSLCLLLVGVVPHVVLVFVGATKGLRL